MLTVWGRANSANVQKVMWCIGELELPHRRIDAGRQFGGNDQDWFLTMNPNGKVPVIDDDGFVLWESNAILRYLADKHRAATLYPIDLRARADIDRWLDWQLGTLGPPMSRILQNLIRKPPEQRDHALIEAAITEAGKLLGILDRQLANRPYIIGDHPTLADIPLGVMAQRWHDYPIERPELPNLAAWYRRLTERPAFREHVMIALS